MIDFRIQLLVVVVVLYMLNKALSGTLQKLGITKSEKEEEQEKTVEKLGQMNYWKPSYYKDLQKKHPRKVALSNPNTVEAYSKLFYDASGVFNDDEEKVFGALRSMKYASQLSQVSERFFQMYKKDLYNYLQSFMSEKELFTVAQIVSKLESGVIK
jgi:hypothetical protein